MQTKADIIHRWYKDVWENGEWDKIERYYTPASDNACLIPGGTISLDEVRELIQVLNDLVSNQHIDIVHSIENGDWVSALVQLDGVRAGTKEPVTMRWQTLVRIADQRIVESYPTVNFLNFFEQLKQLPENSFELLLSGTVLR